MKIVVLLAWSTVPNDLTAVMRYRDYVAFKGHIATGLVNRSPRIDFGIARKQHTATAATQQQHTARAVLAA